MQPLWRGYLALTAEGRFLSVFWLLAGAAGLDVQTTAVHLVWCAVTGALVGSFALRRRFRLPGVHLSVEPPLRVTAGETITLAAHIRNGGPDTIHALRLTGPLLPWDGSYVGDLPGAATIGAGESVTLPVHARFVARGAHHLDPFYVAPLAPLSLCHGEVVQSSGVRFLVVPPVACVERLALSRARRYQPGGVALASRQGESMEVVGVRPYRPGDPVRDLHPRTWARLGVPAVREYDQEYFSRLVVILDTDPWGRPEVAFEAAVSLTAGVVAFLGEQDSIVDLVVAADPPRRVSVGRSLGFIEQALDLLAEITPGQGLDAAAALGGVAAQLGAVSAAVLVTMCPDATDPARGALLESLREQGIPCRVLRVGTPASHPEAAPGLDAILSGEPLVL